MVRSALWGCGPWQIVPPARGRLVHQVLIGAYERRLVGEVAMICKSLPRGGKEGRGGYGPIRMRFASGLFVRERISS